MSRRLSPAGLLLVLAALVMQLAVGAAVGPEPAFAHAGQGTAQAELATLSSLLPGADILCHSDDAAAAPTSPSPTSPSPTSPSQGHHHGDCAICPLCAAFAQPVATLATSPLLPPPTVPTAGLAAPPPQATAPPVVVLTSAQPRAPPSLT